MGSLLAVLALGLFSANVFVVRSASVRLDQQVGVLVALMANVVFGGLLFAADLARRIALDMGARHHRRTRSPAQPRPRAPASFKKPV